MLGGASADGDALGYGSRVQSFTYFFIDRPGAPGPAAD
jgi:hypothetical protein